jgi:hypothetical protein
MSQPYKLGCVLACSLLSVMANAQTAPKVVFTGDNFTLAWQQTTQFTANPNWIGAGVSVGCCYGAGSGNVEAAFQANVINQHPAFVHILTGGSDISVIRDAIPQGVAWHQYEEALVAMVGMAQKANIKVILGNIPTVDAPLVPLIGDDPQSVQLFNTWLANYGLTNNIPLVNYHDALCQCLGATSPNDTFAISLSVQPTEPYHDSVANAAGYALITQMAQIAIQTYGLTIKSGYLSNVVTSNGLSDQPPESQVNNVPEGETVTFIPQAKWSDGVVRPMLNQDYNAVKGTWTSSNPAVMYVNQQGETFAYTAGTANISFRSASGVSFSPWTMTVTEVYYPDI